MKPGYKIALILLAATITGAGIYYFFVTELGKEPELSVSNINPNTKSASIHIGKQNFEYTFKPGTTEQLGKIGMFYTAQVVAYAPTAEDEAARIDVKLMKNGKLVKTKTVYLG